MVYDFGGGTLDLTILKIEGNKFTTIAKDGDNHCGGQDVDNNLVEHFIGKYGDEEGDEQVIRTKPKNLAQFKKSVSFVKMELAGHGNTESEFSTEVGEDDFVVPITKAEFENYAVFPLRQKLTDPIDRIFEQNGVDIQKEDICEIVMVGGSARIPIVQ